MPNENMEIKSVDNGGQCSDCGHKFNFALEIRGSYRPGDIAICGGCGKISMVESAKPFKLRQCTAAEQQDFKRKIPNILSMGHF